MRTRKRSLSLLLCGALLFSLCPQTASAVSIPKKASPHSGHGAVLRNAGMFYASVHRTVTRLLPPTVQVKRVRSYSPESMPSTSSGARVSRAATR